ncbi:DUF6503 family protein [Allomuricauda sp. NBRC 101325]|uniref:DUF6503 family protein n=1 Tax=Allomuricauda sp. NBRC 101325 TaxID=1113758 RepID=UPI0024A3F927|nr:DUF6503 family protein [Muricauda sp. NBRC 101325]GLU44216.1 hypothetical protein Musp01_18400 [Muricauda sp. NBRC 101325]
MKKITILLTTLSILACKETPKKEEISTPEPKEIVVEKASYPETMTQIFDAHGGVKAWKSQRTLSFVLPKPELPETHTVDLWSRMDRVDTEQFSMGFDGKDVWLLDTNENYKGDAAFYHNLMFYFYAMPFVLADDGIMYSETEVLEFEGTSYPGIKIAYQSGVGVSSKDEYYIHFDPETHQMAWLGYTVTYRSGESSDNVKWIRYHDWQNLNGVVLPKSISWFSYEGRELKEPVSTVTFENVMLSKEPQPKSYYSIPEGAKTVPVKVN